MKLEKTDPFPNAPGLSESLGLLKANELPPPVVGWGPWKRRWVSICSGCQDKSKCPRCRTGSYRNVWGGHVGHLVYKLSPKVWQWFANKGWQRR